MGYRSDVVYRIVFSNEDTLKLFVAEAKSRPETALAFKPEIDDEGVDEFLKEVKSSRDGFWELRFEASGWKWYDSFDIVKAHEAIIAMAREYSERQVQDRNDEGDIVMKYVGDTHYAFARIGEDTEDAEVYGSDEYYELLDIHRSISIVE